MIPKSLLPITEEHEAHQALVELLVKVAGAGTKMDIQVCSVAVHIIAAFDNFYSGKKSQEELVNTLKEEALRIT